MSGSTAGHRGSFVSIDFETADEGRESACAVALVRVEDGAVVAREARLIRPPRPVAPVNESIHGLSTARLRGEKPFAEVWRDVVGMLGGADLIVAHNASFDRSVLESCCDAAKLARPVHPWACTVDLARKAWPAWKTHKLPAVCAELGIALKHHDALSDAEACAAIYLEAQKVLEARKAAGAPAESPLPEHLVELRATNGALVFVCLHCGMPERFRGYDIEICRGEVSKRHGKCDGGALMPAKPVPVAAPVVRPVAAPVQRPAPAPAAPAVAKGETAALFGDVAPASPAKGAKKAAAPAKSAIAWSPLQLAIFDDVANGSGHVRILARAGSGKSTTIVEALKHIPEGMSACLMAFGKDAKEDLARKVKGAAEVMTLHGLGYRALANTFGASVYQAKGHENLRAAFPHSGAARKSVGKLVGLAKNRLAWGVEALMALATEFGIDPEPVAEARHKDSRLPVEILAAEAQGQLERSLADTRRFDFDDMIWMPVRLGITLQRWDRLFVDEAQDLNACQIAMLPRAINPGGRIFVVGDDRQAIYGFRGADKNAFARLGRELEARTLPLTVSYRCPKAVASVARSIVEDFEAGPASAEGEVRRIGAIDPNDLEPGDFVISRSNAPLVTLCLDLLAKNRPAVIQGKDVAGELEDLLDRAERENGRGSVAATRSWLEQWHDEQVAARVAQGESTGDIDDQYCCLIALLKRCSSVATVRETLRRACGTDREGSDKIVLTSAHRAKGLERERCYVLASTFLQRPGVEEENLYYVAVTRAKRELVLVGAAA